MLQHCKKWSVARRARVKQVKHWTYILTWYLCPFVQNWKCRTSTEELRFPLGILHCHSLYHPPVGNEELRLSFLLAHCIANGEKRLTVPLSVCAFPLPQLVSGVSIHHSSCKLLLVFAGLESSLSIACQRCVYPPFELQIIAGFCRSGEPSVHCSLASVDRSRCRLG